MIAAFIHIPVSFFVPRLGVSLWRLWAEQKKKRKMQMNHVV
jgi:uncharacterized membrane protein